MARFTNVDKTLQQILQRLENNSSSNNNNGGGFNPFGAIVPASPVRESEDDNSIENAIKSAADREGRLRPPQLVEALTELLAFGKGQCKSLDDVDQMMRENASEDQIDALGPRMKADDVITMVRDAIDTGEIVINDAEPSEVHDEEAEEVDETWATVLRGDPQVRNMMRDLRRATKAFGSDDASYHKGDNFYEPSGTRTKAKRASSDYDAAQAAGGLTAVWASFCLYCSRVPVLDPDGRFRSLWNVLMAFLICWCAVVVPLEIGYDTALRASLGADGLSAWNTLNHFFDFVFIADIILNFRTGFTYEGQLVTNGRRIADHYIRDSFFIDLIGSFPFNLIVEWSAQEDADPSSRLNRQLRMLRIIKLNRLLRLSKLSKYLKYLEVIIEFNPSVTRALYLILLMICCCHWMGCAWWLVTEFELDGARQQQNNWQPSQELLDSHLGSQFASGFFWGAGMVTAMVPYDIEPVTQLETYITGLCMFVGLLLNAFVIGSMASAMANLDSKKQICRGKLETIGLYLLVNHVSADLRQRILEYYEYLYTSSQSMEDLRLLHDLPPSLATRLAITVHKRILTRAPLFNNLSDLALLAVLARLQPVIYVPGQVIVVEGQLLKEVQFIKKGQVLLLSDMGTEDEEVVKTLGPNDNFGLDERAARQLGVELDKAHNIREQTRARHREETRRRRATIPRSDSPSRESNERRGSSATAVFRDGTWYRAFLTSQAVRESARAATYCDVVSLNVAELSQILAKDYQTRHAELKERAENDRRKREEAEGATSGLLRAIKFMGRLKMSRRNSSPNGCAASRASCDRSSTSGLGGVAALLKSKSKAVAAAAQSECGSQARAGSPAAAQPCEGVKNSRSTIGERTSAPRSSLSTAKPEAQQKRVRKNVRHAPHAPAGAPAPSATRAVIGGQTLAEAQADDALLYS